MTPGRSAATASARHCTGCGRAADRDASFCVACGGGLVPAEGVARTGRSRRLLVLVAFVTVCLFAAAVVIAVTGGEDGSPDRRPGATTSNAGRPAAVGGPAATTRLVDIPDVVQDCGVTPGEGGVQVVHHGLRADCGFALRVVNGYLRHGEYDGSTSNGGRTDGWYCHETEPGTGPRNTGQCGYTSSGNASDAQYISWAPPPPVIRSVAAANCRVTALAAALDSVSRSNLRGATIINHLCIHGYGVLEFDGARSGAIGAVLAADGGAWRTLKLLGSFQNPGQLPVAVVDILQSAFDGKYGPERRTESLPLR